MSDPSPNLLNVPRLLFDLHQANRIAQSIYGCLDAREIANRVTQELVEQFNCRLARIWLVERQFSHLKLVASSGLYTNTDGCFGQVPMGAFKVGKIAQNRVSFLSNNLPDEPWVKDRDWAIHHGIQGFAGYPLATPETVVGVLAVFSCEPLAPEFLEILLSLCTTVTVALGNAMEFEKSQHSKPAQRSPFNLPSPMLSDRLAHILQRVPLKLVGTERSLPISFTYLFLRLAEVVQQLNCMTCSLIYEQEFAILRSIIPVSEAIALEENSLQDSFLPHEIEHISFASTCLGGRLEATLDSPQTILQIALQLPYAQEPNPIRVRVNMRSPALQFAFSQMVVAAGFSLCVTPSKKIPLISDRSSLIHESQYVVWVQHDSPIIPKTVKAKIDLETHPTQLRQAIETIMSGEIWGIEDDTQTQPTLSVREREVMKLLTQGLRDRQIANRLYISESTVKFHINNTLAKLKAKTRMQALYQLMQNAWFDDWR
ncbi:LuxR C-terminal-related transcriptional regulator [Roseofilum sp. Guam]|uniref:LuxR C-terminal-related transcriptional regulator n=1 Tax=Roseofilum sp. Guam TaxID=2821502 RepID=UPI001B2210F6|nr:LuxR C-terminal-related transcriptional regulator [Roseofilum sp. Guam]MBP0030456.1 GAF domain-containing protein [Roseofilum sp. Guam]